ncbi:hypothetical protein [Anaerovorax sp. IOR16]|uniref:hypothetical protein n=1 Tax=Anaerovorax sp. IOR16 TaxID=2773458 RepID=UPI0019D1900C|nr:hypothetical protein [Anaerovorax sp. IOR16]
MFRINHSDAIELEHQVRRMFNCDRSGVSGLADADNFESRPMDAAVMVVSYIHAKGLHHSETQYDEFLSKYDTIFSYPDENDADHEVGNFIGELTEIVESYL